MKPIEDVTIIVPYYRNTEMLKEQLAFWSIAPEGIRFIVVDDGSPEPALPIIKDMASTEVLERLQLYRVLKDIPWNRGGARNLGAYQCQTLWMVHIDIDHVLPPVCYEPLLQFVPNPKNWYRFERWRVGRADETRQKDHRKHGVSPRDEYVQIGEHVDSYLVTKGLYWTVGGYDEDYSGCLGGGTPFIEQLTRLAAPRLLPPGIRLHVYTRHAIRDASDFSLSRDTTEYSRRKKEKQKRGETRAVNAIRFPWERLL